MDSRAAVATAEALSASFAELAFVIREAAQSSGAWEADPLRRVADDFLDGLAEISRLDAKSAALKIWLAAGYSAAAEALAGPATSPEDHTGQEMAVVAEVACVLTVSERAAGARIAEAHALATALPLTLSALQAGTISWQHARVMVDETVNLDPAGARALEAHFLDPDAPNAARGCPAGGLIPGRFRHKARTWRERHHPVSIEKRHARGVQDRRVEYAPDRDGMAWLSAYLPADQAAGIWDRTTTAARALQGPHEDRTLSQLRADTVATWLLSNTPSGMNGTAGMDGEPSPGVSWPRAQVLVTVPVLSLLALTEEPAVLDGYGPIPPSMARQLIADGAESLDNEADHLLAWAHGGTTGISNLGQPCPRHHRLRHTTAWKPTAATKNEPPGWISPTGRHYASEHPGWEPPGWPHQVVEQLGHQEVGEKETLQDFAPDPPNPPRDLPLPEGQQPGQSLAEGRFPDWARV